MTATVLLVILIAGAGVVAEANRGPGPLAARHRLEARRRGLSSAAPAMLPDVVASFEERIYQLGSEALSEQERQVAEVRGRGPTLLAGGGVIASLLAEPVFNGAHPDGFSEIAATAIGLLGSSAVLLFVVLLLRPYELGFSVKAGATYRALWDQDILEQPMLDIALAEAFRSAVSTTPRLSDGW